MREILDFFKWCVSDDQESAIIFMSFAAVFSIVCAAYVVFAIYFALSGYPLITGVMFLAPVALVVRAAALKYKDEQGKEN